MKIVCAASVLCGEEAFSTLGDVVVLPEESIRRADLLDADVLISRTKLRITPTLLEGTAVRFVGCAVAGTDHLDQAYLDASEIVWCHAPGCNANSVAEYVLTAMLIEADRHHLALTELTLGVIGVGHIGMRVVEKAMDLGMATIENDPPRQALDTQARGMFQPLEEVLAASDVVTLHVPLTNDGRCATRGMVNHRFFEALKPGALFINTARGEIMDSAALLAALEHGVVQQAVLDVWEDEPRIRHDLLDAVDIGTPHIAGYSHEGRLNGTQMVYEELCHYLEVDPTWPNNGTAADGPDDELVVDATGRSDQEVLTEMVTAAYPLIEDDRRFRGGASRDAAEMGRHFVQCRRAYPVRREFAAQRFALRNASESLLTTAWELGFQISE